MTLSWLTRSIVKAGEEIDTYGRHADDDDHALDIALRASVKDALSDYDHDPSAASSGSVADPLIARLEELANGPGGPAETPAVYGAAWQRRQRAKATSMRRGEDLATFSRARNKRKYSAMIRALCDLSGTEQPPEHVLKSAMPTPIGARPNFVRPPQPRQPRPRPSMPQLPPPPPPPPAPLPKLNRPKMSKPLLPRPPPFPPPSSVLAQHGKASLQPDHPAPTVTAARDSGLEASGHGGGATTEVLIKISGRAPQHGPLQISFGPHATPQTPSRTVPDVPWVIVPKQADVPWEIVAKKARPLPRVPAKALQPPQ